MQLTELIPRLYFFTPSRHRIQILFQEIHEAARYNLILKWYF